MCPPSYLGNHEFWESADPSAASLPTWRGGHEDLSHPVRVPSPAGLQELHTPHYPTGNSHSPARHQPQQSIGYHTFMYMLEFNSTALKWSKNRLAGTSKDRHDQKGGFRTMDDFTVFLLGLIAQSWIFYLQLISLPGCFTCDFWHFFDIFKLRLLQKMEKKIGTVNEKNTKNELKLPL